MLDLDITLKKIAIYWAPCSMGTLHAVSTPLSQSDLRASEQTAV